MEKLTKEQAIVITGFTGYTASKFIDFHRDVEKRLGRPVWTHEFGNKEFADQIKDLYREDFMSMLEQG